MDTALLRAAFAGSLGAEEFRKLVIQVRRARRLRYWRERAWREFVASHPQFACGTEELMVALRVCELHGSELRPDAVKVLQGNVDYTDSYVKTWIRLFPNAATGPVFTEGRPYPEGGTTKVWYCPECRVAKADWLRRRA